MNVVVFFSLHMSLSSYKKECHEYVSSLVAIMMMMMMMMMMMTTMMMTVIIFYLENTGRDGELTILFSGIKDYLLCPMLSLHLTHI